MRTARWSAVSLLVVGGVIAGFAVAGSGSATVTRTTPDPGQFSDPQLNPYFPLVPGTVYRFRGTEDGEHFSERVFVTRERKTIQGVRTIVVRDVLRRKDGTAAEKTEDWYAADNTGEVWYFGENTATYESDGSVESREGSWQAGVDGATAGVVATRAFVHVPAGTFHHVVRTYEWTRLERGVVSLKLYAPGVGPVVDRDVAGGSERFLLVSIGQA